MSQRVHFLAMPLSTPHCIANTGANNFEIVDNSQKRINKILSSNNECDFMLASKRNRFKIIDHYY